MTLVLLVLVAMTFSAAMDTAKTVLESDSHWFLASIPDTGEEYGAVVFTAGITASYVRHGVTWELAGVALAMWLGGVLGAELGGHATRWLERRLKRSV